MSAESLYDPISEDAIRAAKARLVLAGESVDDWARRNGYNRKTVYNVLAGRRMAIRGLSLQIAIKLGLRREPSTMVDQHTYTHPAGRTLAGGLSIDACDRQPKLQVGEAAR